MRDYLPEMMFKIFILDEYPVEFFKKVFTMHILPVTVDKKIWFIRERIEEIDPNNISDFYINAAALILEHYKIEINIEEEVFDEVKKLVDFQLGLQKIDNTYVEELELKYSIGDGDKKGYRLPEFVSWYSYAEQLGQPISYVLNNFTHGQLTIMALASQLLFMSDDDKKKLGIESNDKPNFKKMNKDQIESYYSSKGF